MEEPRKEYRNLRWKATTGKAEIELGGNSNVVLE
jgi:hypothetical protein